MDYPRTIMEGNSYTALRRISLPRERKVFSSYPRSAGSERTFRGEIQKAGNHQILGELSDPGEAKRKLENVR